MNPYKLNMKVILYKLSLIIIKKLIILIVIIIKIYNLTNIWIKSLYFYKIRIINYEKNKHKRFRIKY